MLGALIGFFTDRRKVTRSTRSGRSIGALQLIRLIHRIRQYTNDRYLSTIARLMLTRAPHKQTHERLQLILKPHCHGALRRC